MSRNIVAIDQGSQAVAVTKSDSTILEGNPILYVGVTGDLAVVPAVGSAVVTFKNVAVGWFPVQVKKVMAATTASEIIAVR